MIRHELINPPTTWRRESDLLDAATTWTHRLSSLVVLRSKSTTSDGREWIHVSVSRPDRIPTYEDLCKVKRDFIGDDREAYQVFASKNDHVNLHPHCLHLWSPLDGNRCVANLQDLIDEKAI